MPPKLPLPPMSGDPALYHTAPRGFWKRFGDKFAIANANPGVPLATVNRRPPPGSREEEYAVIATAASDIAFNPYWKRDTRRNYPTTSTITQAHLTNLLLASPKGLKLLPQPTTDTPAPIPGSASATTDLILSSSGSTLTYPAVLAKLHPSTSVSFSFEEGRLPPSSPEVKRRRILRETEKVPYSQNPGNPMNMELHG